MAMLKWIAAALLLLPIAVHADVVSIAAAIAYVADAAGYAYVAYAAYAAAVVATVYGAAEARRQARHTEADQKSAFNASLTDRSITALSAEPPLRIIYGRAITGGDIVGIFSSDKTDIDEHGASSIKPDGYKHIVIHYASHECQAINDILIEGVSVGALDSNGAVTGGDFYKTQTVLRTVSFTTTITVAEPVVTIVNATQTDSDGHPTPATTVSLAGGNLIINDSSGLLTQVTYTVSIPLPSVRIQKHLGAAGQAADAYLMSVVPTQWTSADQLQGLCYIVITLDLEDSRFQGGPPNILADISGRKVLDTRTALTAWTANPALIIRDFLTAEFGFNTLPGDVDTAYCNAAANVCDELIAEGARYTCNGVFTTDGSSESILDDLGACMAGFAVYGANWLIIAGSWTPPVMDLVDDYLDGQIEIVQAGAGIDEIFNGVRGTYIAASQSTPTDFTPYQNAVFAAADGEDLWSDATFPYTNSMGRCRNIARIQTERARSSQVIKYPAKLIAWPLQIGDRVTVTSAEYGFSQKTYRVTDWQFGIAAPVTLQLQEDAAEIYDEADAVTADPTPNTGLPNPWIVQSLTGVTATSDSTTLLPQADGSLVPRVLVKWDAVTDAYVADGSGRIEVLYHGTDSLTWRQVDAQGSDTSAYIVGAGARDYLTIRVRAVNGLGVRGPDAFISGQVSNGSLGGQSIVLPGFVSAAPFPINYQFNALIDPYLITPSGDCDAIVTVVADLAQSATIWDTSASFFGTFADKVSDMTAFDAYSYTTAGTFVQYGPLNGATQNRATYTLQGRFHLTGGVSYYVGLRARGSNPGGSGGIHNIVYIYAAQVQVTLVGS